MDKVMLFQNLDNGQLNQSVISKHPEKFSTIPKLNWQARGYGSKYLMVEIMRSKQSHLILAKFGGMA
jgi:hypothetical protein